MALHLQAKVKELHLSTVSYLCIMILDYSFCSTWHASALPTMVTASNKAPITNGDSGSSTSPLSSPSTVVSLKSSSLLTSVASSQGNPSTNGDFGSSTSPLSSLTTVVPVKSSSLLTSIASSQGNPSTNGDFGSSTSPLSSLTTVVSVNSSSLLTAIASSQGNPSVNGDSGSSTSPLSSPSTFDSMKSLSPLTTSASSNEASTRPIRPHPSIPVMATNLEKTTEPYLSQTISCYCYNLTSTSSTISSMGLFMTTPNSSMITKYDHTKAKISMVSSCYCPTVLTKLSKEDAVLITSTVKENSGSASLSITLTVWESAIVPTASLYPTTTCLWGSLNCNRASILRLSWSALIVNIFIAFALCSIFDMLQETFCYKHR